VRRFEAKDGLLLKAPVAPDVVLIVDTLMGPESLDLDEAEAHAAAHGIKRKILEAAPGAGHGHPLRAAPGPDGARVRDSRRVAPGQAPERLSRRKGDVVSEGMPGGMGFYDPAEWWREPMEGEWTAQNQGKPWRAFKIYRDLGPERTLKAAAARYWETTVEVLTESQYGQMKKLSAKFDWVARAQAHDDHYEMYWRGRQEDHHRNRLASIAEKQLQIKGRHYKQGEPRRRWSLPKRGPRRKETPWTPRL
jgi:hypothetical protein